MPSYEMFAEYYDSLTDNVEYKRRAEYIVNILEKKHNHNLGLMLDLACGTGTLTILLKEMGIDVYGIDSSQEMLSVALQKSAEKGLQILFICQRMQSLDLYGTIDTCVCTLDSLNHITDFDDFKCALYKVSLFMNKGGLFLFDLNTVYKHKNVLADNTFVYETEDVFCVWQNFLGEDNIVDISLDFFANDRNGRYERYSEDFSERAYTLDEVREGLDDAGFSLEAIYGDLSENPPKEDEERIIIVARKI